RRTGVPGLHHAPDAPGARLPARLDDRLDTTRTARPLASAVREPIGLRRAHTADDLPTAALRLAEVLQRRRPDLRAVQPSCALSSPCAPRRLAHPTLSVLRGTFCRRVGGWTLLLHALSGECARLPRGEASRQRGERLMRRTTQDAPQRGRRRAGASRAALPPSSAAEGAASEASRVAAPDFTPYRTDPARFAREVLGSRWWQAQEEIAALVAGHRRVAVKAANGVGKTYLAADLTLWFLYCHRPSIVLTTAPTWRQVESLLWEEIRRRHNTVNVAAEVEPARPKLEGSLMQTRLKIADGHFAMGLSTDEPVRFQGFHAENLLVVLDEACGVPEEIWDAVEGVCVGGNNRVLAISNPLSPTGRFYSLFQSPRWQT